MRLNICKSGRDAREISVYSVFFVRISSVAYNGIRKMISNKEQWKNYFAECLKGSEIQIWLIWMATQILVNLNRSLFVLNMRLFILLSSCGLISNREDSLSSNPKQIIRRQANFILRILKPNSVDEKDGPSSSRAQEWKLFECPLGSIPHEVPNRLVMSSGDYSSCSLSYLCWKYWLYGLEWA